MTIKAEARYKKLNFFDMDGGVQKREQFLKEPGKATEVSSAESKSKEKEKENAASQGLGL